MNPLVSILIPAYNAERWVAASIRSALEQTWERKEIIVVDDGSKDQTLSILRQFESKGVKVHSQPNQGAAAARNKAFSLCSGDYIQWLDADDLLAPDKIERQMKVSLAEGGNKRTLLSSAWGYFIYRPEKAKFSPTSLWCDLPAVEWLIRYFGRGHWMQTSTWLVSRELTEAAGPWNTQLLGDDDGEYFSRVILASNGVRFVPESKVFYRRTPNSLSYIGQSDRKLEAQFLSMQLQITSLQAVEDGEVARAACVRYLQKFLIYFFPERADIVEKAKKLAEDLGGQLQTPSFSWKYAWIQKLFGWIAAKRAQLHYNRIKASILRGWDYTLYRLGV